MGEIATSVDHSLKAKRRPLFQAGGESNGRAVGEAVDRIVQRRSLVRPDMGPRVTPFEVDRSAGDTGFQDVGRRLSHGPLFDGHQHFDSASLSGPHTSLFMHWHACFISLVQSRQGAVVDGALALRQSIAKRTVGRPAPRGTFSNIFASAWNWCRPEYLNGLPGQTFLESPGPDRPLQPALSLGLSTERLLAPKKLPPWPPAVTDACAMAFGCRSEEHTSELQSHSDLVCRLLLEKKKKKTTERRLKRDSIHNSKKRSTHHA